ncbi:MAG: ribonuclease H [Myxococcota bacterium]
MGWRVASFKDQRVHAEVDAGGALAARGGRVAIRYSDAEGAKLYRAAASRVQLLDGPVRDLPAGVDADAAPAKKPASKGSGFGKAGTRTAAQASAAAADARSRLAALPPETVVAFTDGSCRGNPGPAGSGVVVQLPDGRSAEASVALGRATNNIAELTAIAVALELLDEGGVPPEAPVALFTDSSYANGVLTLGWKAKANAELIAKLRAAVRRRPGLTLHWVAGHVGVEGNERADALANRGVAGTSARTPFQ